MRTATGFGLALATVLLTASCGDDGAETSEADPSASTSGNSSSGTASEDSGKSKRELKAIKLKKARKAARAARASAPAGSASPSDAGAAAAAEAEAAAGIEKIRVAAQTLSDAFLTGDSATAFDLLSARCQEQLRADYGTMVSEAQTRHGKALPFKTFEAEVAGDTARASYTYSVASLDKDDEPWVFEQGRWKNDGC